MNAPPALPAGAAALGVSFDGRSYHYLDYSYERLEDALDYAQLDQSRPGPRGHAAPRHWKQWDGPTPEELQQMAQYGIAYERGQYVYGPYRYDQLSAALAYAQHEPGLARPGRRDEGSGP